MAYPTPYLVFGSVAGLDRKRFNTLRLGGGWKKRLKVGDRILLATKVEIIGSAVVSYIDCGTVSEILLAHARDNHIELALASSDPDYSVELAPQRRLESMRKNYGPNRVSETSLACVIGLRR